MSTTAPELLWTWWDKCIQASRMADCVHPEAVESLIESSRRILTAQGATKRDADSVLFGFYTRIRWDFDQPTDRVFESMLEIELTGFFAERGLQA